VACYLIVELKEDSSPMTMDFKMEQERRLRPIHRYCRVERFESVLAQLIACKGKVPYKIVRLVKEQGYDPHPDRVWNSVRAILKANKGNEPVYLTSCRKTVLQQNCLDFRHAGVRQKN